MDEFLRESIIENFNDRLIGVTAGDFVRTPVIDVALRRNDDLALIFELTSHGWAGEKPERYPAGTVRAADEVIEFTHPFGWIGIARGVIAQGIRSRSRVGGDAETVETYSAHSVEWRAERQVEPVYVVEWISNVPSRFSWNTSVRFSSTKTVTKTAGTGPGAVSMKRTSESGGSQNALHLNVSGIDLYIMHSLDRDAREKGLGQIAYTCCPEQAFRDKIRICLSFALGKPIVYLGHTEYSQEWEPTFMRSVAAFTANGNVFKLNDLPPYPINHPRYENIGDEAPINSIVNALFQKYDAIRLNDLSWSYWYAVCAPIHTAPIHFGSIIEQLQRNYARMAKTVAGKLLDDDRWQSLKKMLLASLKEADVGSDLRPILESKISSLNQAPQNLILKRLLATMGLEIGEAEINAWKHRNMAAHGGIPEDPIELIVNNHALKILFHRLLAAITDCSDRYIDYYSFGHPVRSLAEGVPRRPSRN